MKRIFIIILVLITFQSFGQKWSLNSIYRSKKYSFEYLFRLDNLDDTSSYQLTKRIGQKKSTIEIFDNQRDTVVLANIKLSNKINDSIIILTSDFNGQSNIKLQGGEYKLEISAQNYDNFDMTFSVTTEEYISLKINLGLAQDLYGYSIVSKKKLAKDELQMIMECVKKNRIEFHEKCSDKRKYLVLKML